MQFFYKAIHAGKQLSLLEINDLKPQGEWVIFKKNREQYTGPKVRRKGPNAVSDHELTLSGACLLVHTCYSNKKNFL